MKDLNRQANEWVGNHDRTPNKRTKLVPLEKFELEHSDMIKVYRHLPRPYRQHQRVVDQYGYINFDSSSYWVRRGTERKVTVLEYADEINIYSKNKLI